MENYTGYLYVCKFENSMHKIKLFVKTSKENEMFTLKGQLFLHFIQLLDIHNFTQHSIIACFMM